jgi:hypothetical protein
LGAGPSAAGAVINREELRSDLKSARAENRWYFVVILALAVVLFGLTCWSVMTAITVRSRGAGLAGFGVTSFGLLVWSRGLWRDKVLLDSMSALATYMDEKTLHTAFTALLNGTEEKRTRSSVRAPRKVIAS